jgi:hypothetical protein
VQLAEQMANARQEVSMMTVGDVSALLELANNDARMYFDRVGEILDCRA